MINCTAFNNELRGTNNIIDISNIVNKDIVISTSIYIALRGVNMLFILLRW